MLSPLPPAAVGPEEHARDAMQQVAQPRACQASSCWGLALCRTDTVYSRVKADSPRPPNTMVLNVPVVRSEKTALESALLGHVDALTAQLDAGVPINMLLGDGSSLLTAAASASRTPIMELLIARGVDVNHVFMGDTVRGRAPVTAARRVHSHALPPPPHPHPPTAPPHLRRER